MSQEDSDKNGVIITTEMVAPLTMHVLEQGIKKLLLKPVHGAAKRIEL